MAADTATQMMDYIKSTIESNETLMEQLPLSLACGAMGLCILFPSYLFPILPMSIIIGTAYGIYTAPAVMSFAALVVVLLYFAFTYWLHLEWVRILSRVILISLYYDINTFNIYHAQHDILTS